MEYNFSDIKDFVEISKPLIDPIINALVKPKIDKLAAFLKKREINNKVGDNFFEDKFAEYLERTANKCLNINVLIFPNQQIKLNEIYIPLSLKSTKNLTQYSIDKFDIKFLQPNKKIVIADTAGMGKSTIMKWIGYQCIKDSIAKPILIELRNLSEVNTVMDEIFNQFNSIDKDFDKELLLKFLDLGNFIILFDGFDEIQLKNQDLIIKDIRDFINKTSKNFFILTSRPEGALVSFGDFQLFNILPLERFESFNLIKKYDNVSPVKIGDRLISDINKSFTQSAELLENPFLVSLIYSTYAYNKDIPSNKATFYEEIYSALFKRHDLSKDGWARPKKSKLDIQDFKIILRQLAFDTAIIGEITYTESELISYIEKAKSKSPGINFNHSDYFEDLLSTVPLFQKDGLKIKWAHKSLQDYFSADYIAFSSNKDSILEKIYQLEKDNFLNVLELFYDIDYKSYRKIIVKNILNDYIVFHAKSYKDFTEISKLDIDERKSLTFGKNTFILKTNSKTRLAHITTLYDQIKSEIPNNYNPRIISINESYVLIDSYGFKYEVLKFITSKKEKNLVSKIKEISSSTNLIMPLKSGKHLISDDINYECNKKSKFKKVNAILKMQELNKFILLIEKVEKEIKIIDEDIKIENAKDVFDI